MRTKNPFTNRIIGYGTKPADQFQANPANYRTHPQKQRDAVQASLRELGWIGVVVENRRSGQLIDGHERVWQALANNEDVPYIEVDLSPDEEKLALAIFDPITYMAETDAGILDALLRDVNTGEQALQELLAEMAEENGLYGDAPGEAQDVAPQVDRAEELRQKWGVESGQLWVIPSKSAKGEHRILCGDCTSPSNLTLLMNGQRAKLFATDPPYGVAYNDETGSGVGDTIANDENDGVKLQAFLEDCFRAWLPHLDEHAAWYLWHAQLTQGFFAAAAAAAADILIHRQIIWVKPSLILGHGDYHWRHELCFYGWRKGNRPAFYGERNQTTIWEVGRTNDTPHPTEKPPELWYAPMENNTKRGEICAEPFCGSGSQFVAGEQKARLVYGSDLEPKWIAVTLQRLADLGLEPRLDRAHVDSNVGLNFATPKA